VLALLLGSIVGQTRGAIQAYEITLADLHHYLATLSAVHCGREGTDATPA